jgi:hypothetical protein
MRIVERLKRALRTPQLFARGLNRLAHRRGGLRSENTSGVDVFAEDWDTLVVLDACRYDMFEMINHLPGTLSEEISRGASTTEWLKANFDGQKLRDTVYVTANPQFEQNRLVIDTTFHEVINVWLEEGWDAETGTVRAETMTDIAVSAHERFPNKRILVHYLQPHYPFVPSDTAFDKDHISGFDSEGNIPEGENVWSQKLSGQLPASREKLWSMYVDNLEYVLEHVETLFESVQGKIVVTADHGNYVGERASPIPIREYGHPRGLYDEVLVQVPWLEFIRGDRREISTGAANEPASISDTDIISQRLENLGYKP